MLQTLKYKLFGKAVAKQLSEQEFYDADWLLAKHIIGIKAMGRTITEIDLDVENLSNRKIKVVMPLGIYFAARGSHQNMVGTREVVFRLKPHGSKFATVHVACLNAHRNIPGKQDGFTGLSRADEQVVLFLEAARNETPMVVQAGVWALTDGLSRGELKRRLTTENGQRMNSQAISDGDIDSAGLHLAKLRLATEIS